MHPAYGGIIQTQNNSEKRIPIFKFLATTKNKTNGPSVIAKLTANYRQTIYDALHIFSHPCETLKGAVTCASFHATCLANRL